MVRRFSQADLPEIIPVFPLPGALLLPRGRLPLNIFEPRYLAMLEDVLKSDHRLIGMVQPVDEQAEPPELRTVGCAGRITAFNETGDGRYVIVLTGISRFRTGREVEGFTAYRRIHPGWDCFGPDLDRPGALPDFDKDGFLVLLQRYFDVAGLSSDWESVREAEPEVLVDSLSMMCPFDTEEKQALLEAPDLAARAEALTALMRFAIAEAGNDQGKMQ